MPIWLFAGSVCSVLLDAQATFSRWLWTMSQILKLEGASFIGPVFYIVQIISVFEKCLVSIIQTARPEWRFEATEHKILFPSVQGLSMCVSLSHIVNWEWQESEVTRVTTVMKWQVFKKMTQKCDVATFRHIYTLTHCSLYEVWVLFLLVVVMMLIQGDFSSSAALSNGG